MKYIKSMLNYTGGKHKILSQITPHFCNKINTFVDLFCGGGNVFINVDANVIIANDICHPIIDLFRNLRRHGLDSINYILKIMDDYEIKKKKSEAYSKLRDDYNQNPSWDKFYALVCCSFNNQIRFNRSGKFNMPFGRRSFNPSMQEKFKSFVTLLMQKNINFMSENFMDFRISELTKDDFVFVDAPYLLGTATYNESSWNLKCELALLKYLDELSEKGIRWLSTNVTHHKGMTNDYLIEFGKAYDVVEINNNYKNCNYQIKDREQMTREVIIKNY